MAKSEPPAVAGGLINRLAKLRQRQPTRYRRWF